MLGFFRINDPYRLLILFLAVLLLRLPYLIGSKPLVYETNWLLIGEALNSGKVLYKDLISPIAPFSAWVYMIIEFLFGKSILVLQILSVLLATYQFSLFNNIMLRNKAYNENSYIPALLYALMMFTFYDFFTLSPTLISLTFILLVLDNIYLRIENKLDDATILKTGLFMGIAVLFYLPSILFFVATILSFAMLTSLVLRRYLLFLYGFLFPFGIVFVYFFWQESLGNLINQWIEFNFLSHVVPISDFKSIMVITALPVLVFLVSLYKTFAVGRFTNYQVRVQQVMFIMFLAALGSWWFTDERAPYELLLFIPSIAFFITHFILQYKKKIRAEIFAFVFSVLLIILGYSLFYQNTPLHKYGDFNKLQTSQNVYHNLIKNKKAMILGAKPNAYKEAKSVATKYFHPELSSKILGSLNKKERLIQLYDDIQQHQPEIIIDLNGYFKNSLNEMPLIESQYTRKSKNIFQLTNKEG
ncbi:MAG: hypothetical protein DSY77_01995 [Bacteroidetes bacterium]|nr:MAG: hypothetical protein DSY77_01995 [Bacteroidota bacterium]